MSFTYKGKCSDVMGFNITKRSVYNAPAFDINSVEVPGRSGDVLVSQNRYKNKNISYTGFLKAADFPGASQGERLSFGLRQLKGWLCSDVDYHDLKDTYDIGFTRKAFISGETAISDVLDRPDGAELTVTFNCEPFIYKDEEPYVLAAAGGIYNPFEFDASPRLEITMTAAGSLTVGDKTWNISTYSGTLIYDSMDWYDASNLKNSIVTGDGFPVLKPGKNNISWTGGISGVKIYPRFRTL